MSAHAAAACAAACAAECGGVATLPTLEHESGCYWCAQLAAALDRAEAERAEELYLATLPDAEPPAPNDPAAGNPRLTSPPPGGSPRAARPRLFPVIGPGFEGAVLADDDADAERRARAFGPDAEVAEVVWMSSSEAMPVTTRRCR